MNTISIQGKRITINQKTIDFEHEVDQTIDLDKVVIVMTTWRYDNPNNIFGVINGEIAWRVQDILEYYNLNSSPFAPDSYTTVYVYSKDTNLVIATSGNGFRFLINPHNGKIVGMESWVK